MRYWFYFWAANFILAGSAFVFITIIVSVRGIADLRAMIRALNEHGRAEHSLTDTKSEKPS
jgi:hypothetical protein